MLDNERSIAEGNFDGFPAKLVHALHLTLSELFARLDETAMKQAYSVQCKATPSAGKGCVKSLVALCHRFTLTVIYPDRIPGTGEQK